MQAILDPNHPVWMAHTRYLAEKYRTPVFKYVLSLRGVSADLAEEITQEFFRRLLERGLPESFRPRAGSFRAYLKRCLRNLRVDLIRERRRAVSLRIRLPNDALLRCADPESILDRAWAEVLLDDALEKLRLHLQARGRARHFDVFLAYYGFQTRRRSDSVGALERDLVLPQERLLPHVQTKVRLCRSLLLSFLSEAAIEYLGDDDDPLAEVRQLLLA